MSEFKKEFIELDKDLTIGFINVTKSMIKSYTPFHWHESIEVIWLKSGHSTVRTMSGNTYNLRQDSLLWISPYEIHDIRSDADTSFLLLMIPIEMLNKYYPEYNNVFFHVPADNISNRDQTKFYKMRQLLHQMEVSFLFKEKGYLLHFYSQLFEFLYMLFHYFSRETEKSHSLYKEEQRLHDIIAYTYDNFTHNITIEEIAEKVHLQPQYFCHYFKKTFGQTYLNYLYSIRMSHIEPELIHSNLSITFIAEKYGFASMDLFRRKFIEKNECTPREYRKKYKLKEKD